MNFTWNLGTMGFGYQDWHGPFYPEHLDSRKQLSYYARFFNAVEIDSTFYGTPRKSTLRRWKNITPDGFHFCLKIPRRITHEFRLQGEQALGMALEFLTRVDLLGEKLGVILFQFPPSFGFSGLERLAEFFQRLNREARMAAEFRHPSWYQSQTGEALASLNISWAFTEFPDVPVPGIQTAGHVYVRWIGQHGTYTRHVREQVDLTPNLVEWKNRFENILSPGSQIFGFFNNDYSGFAPQTCNRYKTLLGLPTETLAPPRQGRLF